MNEELELEVFRAGDYGPKGRWDADDLDAIAAAYKSGVHEAPVTLDHAQSGPALGWVAGLRRAGDRLIARLHGMSPDLLRAVREGAFRKRSVELYRNLPEAGGPYLKAVSFLGAGAPAVRGLVDPIFAAEEPNVTFRADGGEYVAFEHAARGECDTGEDQAFAELSAELRTEGRWNPRWDERGLKAFHRSLGEVDTSISEGDLKVTPARWFADFLRGLPKCMPIGEAAPAQAFGDGGVPRGANVSGRSIHLHRRATQMCAHDTSVDYAEALIRCAREV